MPSGKTHDAITFILAAPMFGASYLTTQSALLSAIVTSAFVFGGVMFGPDLDTGSKQYSRWGPLRSLWFPYRACFKHRSRWSHGMVFGTLIRVIYFLGISTIAVFFAAYTIGLVVGSQLPHALDFLKGWRTIGGFANVVIGSDALLAVFAGMWAGSASHTLTDMTVSYVKTGRLGEFL